MERGCGWHARVSLNTGARAQGPAHRVPRQAEGRAAQEDRRHLRVSPVCRQRIKPAARSASTKRARGCAFDK